MGIVPLPYSARLDAINTLSDGFIKLQSGMPVSVTLASIAVSGSASDLTSGTLPDARLSSNVALKNASQLFTGGNTFSVTQVFEASVCVGIGALGPRIRQGTGQVFRLNTNDDSARAALEVGAITATGTIITGYDVSGVGLYTSAIRHPGNGSLSLDSPGAAGNVIVRVGPSYAEGLRVTTTGALWFRSNVWHADGAGASRVYYEAGSTTYYGGHGSTPHIFRNSASANIFLLQSDGTAGLNIGAQSGRSFSISVQNTADRTGVRIYDYGAFTSASNQSGFEVAYLGGTFGAPSTTVAGHYRNLLSFRTGGSTGALSTVPSFAIRSTIGSVIGSSLSEVNTSMMVTSTSTGLTIPVMTMLGNSGLVDFPQGQIQLGTNVRLKNNSGDFHVRNSTDSDFGGISASTGNFSNIIYANNGVRVSGLAGVQFSSATPVPGSGSLPWLEYTANTNILFLRDATNGRMHVTYTQGANSLAANTTYASRLTVESYITSAFQSLSSDPSTVDIGDGKSRLVKNTTANEIRHWVNDGGVMKKSGAFT